MIDSVKSGVQKVMEHSGPRSFGRRHYDAMPWWARVITTSGIAGLIAVYLLSSMIEDKKEDRKQRERDTIALIASIKNLEIVLQKETEETKDTIRQALEAQERLNSVILMDVCKAHIRPKPVPVKPAGSNQ